MSSGSGPRQAQSLFFGFGLHHEYGLHLILLLTFGVLVVSYHLRDHGGRFSFQRQHDISCVQDLTIHGSRYNGHAHGMVVEDCLRVLGALLCHPLVRSLMELSCQPGHMDRFSLGAWLCRPPLM